METTITRVSETLGEIQIDFFVTFIDCKRYLLLDVWKEKIKLKGDEHTLNFQGSWLQLQQDDFEDWIWHFTGPDTACYSISKVLYHVFHNRSMTKLNELTLQF